MKKIYRKITNAYMFKNKSKTIMLFISIVSTLALMFALDTIRISQVYNKVEAYKTSYGDYHTEYLDISRDKMLEVQDDKRVAFSDNVQNLGNLVKKENGTKSELKSFEGYKDIESNYFDRKHQKLDGRKPRNNNEIVIDEETAKNFDLGENPIGKSIYLDLLKEYKLPTGEEKLYSDKKKFKVVGIVKKINEDISEVVQTGAEQKRRVSYTYGNKNRQSIIPDTAITYDIIVRFNSKYANSIESEINAMDKLEEVAADYEIGRNSFYPNSDYIGQLSMVEMQKEIKYDKNSIIVIVMVILLIFNVMNIMWNDYLKEIGSLRLIGATKNNVRSMLIYQSLVLAIFGTIFGILFGMLISKVGLIMFKDSTLDNLGIVPKVHIDNDIIKQTIIISLLSILLATIIPIIKIGRVSPMENIRMQNKQVNKGKQSKIGVFIQKILGIYGYFGIRNLCAKKTRTIISIISIGMCGYLIIYTFSSIQSEEAENINKIYYPYDIEVKAGISNDKNTFEIDENKVEKIENMNGVKFVNAKYDVTSIFMANYKEINDYFKEFYGIEKTNKIEYSNHLRFYTNKAIEERIKPYVSTGNIDSIKDKSNGYINVAVFNYFYDPIKTHTLQPIYNKINVGDIITLGINYHNGDKIERKNINVRIAAILDESWQGYGEQLKPAQLEVITSEENMKELMGIKAYNKLGVDYVNPSDRTKNKKIESYIEKNIPGAISTKYDFTNLQDEGSKKTEREGLLNIILIIAISIINIFCTVKSNLMSKKKEIFTMRALGMSLKDMNKMNMYESITYSISSILLGIGVSLYSLKKLVNENNSNYKNLGIEQFMDFTFPYKEAIIFAVVTLATCIIAVKLANRDFKNKEISDGMRDID